jgi:hypothetical protein
MLIASAPHPREQQRKKGKIMGLFDKFMKKKEASNSDECVLIHLDGVHLPDQVYQECDLSTLEDMLIEAIESSNAGELDGNEIGPTETTIFTYGPDADQLYRAMEQVLKDYPLSRNARIVIRKGGPGSPQTEVHL